MTFFIIDNYHVISTLNLIQFSILPSYAIRSIEANNEGAREKGRVRDLNILKGPPIEQFDLLLDDRHCYSSVAEKVWTQRSWRDEALVRRVKDQKNPSF